MSGKSGNKGSKKQQQEQKKQQQKNIKILKRPTLTLNKRNEVTSLVNQLLETCFVKPVKPTEEWQQFMDINAIVEKIRVLEAQLNPNLNETPAERLNNMQSFQAWAIENGCQCNGVSVAEYPGYELGLRIDRKINEGEQILTVPREVMLTEMSLDELEDIQPKFNVMSNLKLTYVLILASVNPKSFWAPYIKILPKNFTSVGFFSVENMQQLRGSNVLSAALQLWKSVARQYAFIYNVLQNQMTKGKTEAADMLKNQFSYDLYRWGMSVVMTRENMIPRTAPAKVSDIDPNFMIALVPLWDMVNHRAGSLSTVYDVEKKCLEMTAPMALEAGEQLFMYYGKRCNADMLLHNGFVDVDNAHDNIPLKLGISRSDPLFEKRTNLFTMVTPDVNKNDMELHVLPAPDYFSPHLLAFVRIFNMNEQQLDHWLEDYERAQDLKHIDCALETQLEQKTWYYLKTRMMLNLRSFPSTLEQDEERLSQMKSGQLKLGKIEANILQYLILEKRMLSAALDYANLRIKT